MRGVIPPMVTPLNAKRQLDKTGVKNMVRKYTNKKKEVDYFDGISFVPTLLGRPGQQQHEFLYWEFEETDQIGVRMGDWKMVVKSGKPLLYNLALDIHEDTDIASQHPDIVRKMLNVIHEQHIDNPNFKVTIPPMLSFTAHHDTEP